MTTPLSSATTTTIIIVIFIIATITTVSSLGQSSTIAVISSSTNTSATVCGITAGEPTQRIQCYRDGLIIPVQPDTSYDSISGGSGFFCGLRSGGATLLCWKTTAATGGFLPKRIYHNYSRHPLTALTVGDSQICAIQSNTTAAATAGVAICWRFLSPDSTLEFRTITSGGGFSCGILKNRNRVMCWGGTEIGAGIQDQFGNTSMSSLVAGESHACGVTKAGTLVCRGSNSSGQLNVPTHYAYEFSSLALGANHSCAIRRENGLVVCWGGGPKRLEFVTDTIAKNVSFESIVAGLDFTCGLTTRNLSIICWGPGWTSRNLVPLGMVIPAPCVVHQDSCSVCGVYPNSDTLCSGSGTICRSCEGVLPFPAILPPMPLPSAPPSRSSSRARKRLFWVFGIVGSIGCLAGICVILYCLWSAFLHKKLHSSVQPTISVNVQSHTAALPPRSSSAPSSLKLPRQKSGTSSSKRTDHGVEKIPLPELAAATNNFSLENKIGAGSFGTVYKGKLADGRKVAIKRGESGLGLKSKKFQDKESAFESELASLSRLHHKHSVELVGFCQENDERLLVYEYMSNGSLHDHLHSKNNVEKDSSILNSWRMRIKIALDAARGIEYLHNYAVPPIIHRDIKSSNILLDTNWTGKVSDFGLSLMGPEADQESMSTKAAGTVGYIDPEYYVLNILTAKSDVYGFGVVLLELLTGKRAVFKEEGTGPLGVVEYAVPRISAGELKSVLDGRVGCPEMNEMEAVELMAYTATHCVSLEGKERPTVTDIVSNLERALSHCDDPTHGSFDL